MTRKPLPASFYRRDTELVARELLGARLCRVLPDGTYLSGLIVETEAYLGAGDRACHTYGGRRTTRTETMFAPGGVAYVYLIYGMYYCLNAVTRSHGEPEAVLIRALAAETGQELWAERFPRLKPRQWLSGPGRLCRAMGIGKAQDGLPLQSEELWIE
ncbi:MAG: D-3-methyladenine glycosylase, partial [Moraxellaceae bacterium]|nr:D-3-methyladenine glycosylase [Moraxellaceae bacterium]